MYALSTYFLLEKFIVPCQNGRLIWSNQFNIRVHISSLEQQHCDVETRLIHPFARGPLETRTIIQK